MAADDIQTEVDSLTRMAKRIGLKGGQIAKYVQEHMEKLGYQATTHVTYSRKADGGGAKGGGFLAGLFSGDGGDGDNEDL